jgi:hypothetical protein
VKAGPQLQLSGGIYIWYYQPFLDDAKYFAEPYAAWLSLVGSFGDFGVYFEPRWRNTPLRGFFFSNVWIQEAYGRWTTPAGTLKLGKLYTRLGRFWDGSFYGNLPYFDGLKLDTDMGLSFEGVQKLSDLFSLDYAVQYLLIDGQTNGSLVGRDTLSQPGARQRHQGVARIAAKITPMELLAVTIGASGQVYQADFDAVDDEIVVRVNGEAEVKVGPVGVWLDFTKQLSGRAVLDYPAVGAGSEDVIWVWTGAYFDWRWLSLRYNFSWVDYQDADITEMFHHPGATIAVHDNISILAEYVFWKSGPSEFDNSLNLILYGSF